MQSLNEPTGDDTEMVEFLQTNYDNIDPDKPLYKFGRRKIYLKDLKNFVRATDARRKGRLNLLVKKVMKENKVDTFKNLLAHGYRLSAINDKGETAIHFAFRNEYDFLKHDKGKLLFSASGNFNHSDSYGLSLFHIACALGNTVVVKKYLNTNADINAQCDFEAEENSAPTYEYQGFSPLHFAVKYHRYDVVKLLLEQGADVEVKDAEERTPLWITTLVQDYDYPSCWENDLKIIEILIKYGSNVNYKDENGWTAVMDIFSHCIYHGKSYLMQSEFDVESDTFINKSIEIHRRKRQQEILEIFIKNGADVSLRPKNGYTLLHSVVENLETIRDPDYFEFISFDDKMYVEIIQLILNTSNEIDVSSKSISGKSPLSLAVSYISLDIVKLLLNYTTDLSSIKFDPNSKSFHYLNTIPTLECARNLIAIIELLMDKGYNLTLEDNLTIMKFLIHGIDECKCCRVVGFDDFGNALNFFSPIHISCLKSIENYRTQWKLQCIQDLTLTLELVEYGKLYIHEEIKNEIQKFLRKFSIPWPPNLYLDQRVEEIKQMKSVKLRSDIDLYDIMTKHPHSIYPYIRNIIFEDKLFEDFELYEYIIKGHLTKAVTRHYVETSAHNYLQISLFSSLPYMCCREILSYLNNKDIYNLCLTILTYDLEQ